MKYSAIVNDSFEFQDIDAENSIVAGKKIEWDLQKLGHHKYSIIYNGKVFNAEVLLIDREACQVSIKINGRIYNSTYSDEYQQLLQKMGIGTSSNPTQPELKAPMPGMVIKVLAVTGQQIKKGDPLLILEAMKMENIIKAASDCSVTAIHIRAGDKVEKNQVIMNFANLNVD